MERLTTYEPCEGGIPFVTVKNEQDALQRLAAYEDAEEQGRMVALPCKVGDTVYVLCGKDAQKYTVYHLDIFANEIFTTFPLCMIPKLYM